MNVERSTARGVAHYPGVPAPAPARVRPLLLILMTALLAACGGGDPVRKPAPSARVAMPRSWPVVEPADPARANSVLMRAIGLVGTPYRWGGNTPESGFDCSGLVNYVFRDMAAVQLPRTSRDLVSSGGPKVALNRLAAADLVFFSSGSTVTHVGIYVGEGRFVHAPSSGGTVRLDHLDGPYWAQHYAGARRVLQ